MTEEVRPVSFDISKAVVSLKGKTKFDELSKNDIENLIQIDFKVNYTVKDFKALDALLPVAQKVNEGRQLSDEDKAKLEMILKTIHDLDIIDGMAALPEDDKKTETKTSDVLGADNQREDSDEIKQRQVTDPLASGILKTGNNDFQGAIDDFTKAIKLNGLDIQAYKLRGDAYAQLGQFENALKDYNQHILNSDSNNPEDFFVRGRILESLNRFEEALDDYKRANDLNDENDTHHLKTCLDLSIKTVSEKIEAERAKTEAKTEEPMENVEEEDDDSIQIIGNDNIHKAIQSDIHKGTSKLRRISDKDLIMYLATQAGYRDMGQISSNGKPEDTVYIVSKLNTYAAQCGISERICGVRILFAKTIELVDPNDTFTWSPVEINPEHDYKAFKEEYDKDHTRNLQNAVQGMVLKLLPHFQTQTQIQQ